MITAQMVRTAASFHGVRVTRTDGEWRLTLAELHGKRAEDVAYYTDDNEDAYLTIPAMRRNAARG